ASVGGSTTSGAASGCGAAGAAGGGGAGAAAGGGGGAGRGLAGAARPGLAGRAGRGCANAAIGVPSAIEINAAKTTRKRNDSAHFARRVARLDAAGSCREGACKAQPRSSARGRSQGASAFS